MPPTPQPRREPRPASAVPRPAVLVVGSSNTDMIVTAARVPLPGETVLGGAFTIAAGGKGANQAVAAARAGAAVTFVARVGRDANGDRAVAGFLADGINADHVIRDRRFPSGVALIVVGANGDNSIAVAPGANGHLSSADIRGARGVFRRGAIVLLQLEIPLDSVRAAAQLATLAGARVVLNPAPARPLPATLLRQTFVLTPNASEAAHLTGLTVTGAASASKAADRLLARGVANVIITLGPRGALVAGPGVRERIPGHRVRAVDATGAGDVFNGALAVALAENRSITDAARFANAAAALSVTRAGAQPSAPSRRDIERLLARGGFP